MTEAGLTSNRRTPQLSPLTNPAQKISIGVTKERASSVTDGIKVGHHRGAGDYICRPSGLAHSSPEECNEAQAVFFLRGSISGKVQ